MKDILARIGITALFAMALVMMPVSQASAGIVKAQCDKGESLQERLDNKAVNGDTVIVTGTCVERITVTIDNLTLDGGGTAVIDGAGMGGDGTLMQIRSDNVTITGLTVRNSPGNGISVARSASVEITSSIVELSARNGILISSNAYGRIGGATGNHALAGTPGSVGNFIRNNGRNGISVGGGSAADIFHNVITGNDRGISMSAGGAADIDGNQITANDDRGISIIRNATVRLSGDRRHGEANLIENNNTGVRCRQGGAVGGDPQDFGVGNPGGGDHSNDTNITGSCPVSSGLGF